MHFVYAFLLLLGAALTAGQGSGFGCSNDEDCSQTEQCKNRQCECRPGHVFSTITNTCLRGMSQKCERDSECVEDAYCALNGECQCRMDLQPSQDGLRCEGDKWYKIPDSTCSWLQDCDRYGQGVACNEKTKQCECNFSTQHFAEGRCRYSRSLEEQCSETLDCFLRTNRDRVECSSTSNTCTCKAGFTPDEDRQHCDGSAGISTQVSSFAVLFSMFLMTRVISV